MAAPPSYEEHITQRWALEACADDPAMQAAFRAAGARDGWVAGLDVRAYCEREGLMQTASSNRGVPKQALARAWALADSNRDARGLRFEEFCVFMHLLAVVSAGGELPRSLPSDLAPPPPKPPTPSGDEALARSLQRSFDDEQRPTLQPVTLPEQRPTLQPVTLPDGSTLAPAQLRSLLLSQGGVLEIGRVLYACDEALENERWRAGGAGFSAQHLLENEGAWSSEDGSLVGPDRDAIAPPRDATVWSLEAPWHAHVDVRSGATDRRGWAYCRSLPNGSEETSEGSSGTPFAGAVARRRRWLRVYSRDLAPPRITVHATPVEPVKRPPPAFLLRLQDGWRSGLDEVQRRLSREKTTAPEEPSDVPFAERWAKATRCKASLDAFVRNFGKHETSTTSDDARAARVKRFLAHAERLLRAQPGWATQEPETFEVETLDRVVSKLFRQLEEAGFRLIAECDADDASFEKRVDALAFLTFVEIDAPDVEALAPFSDALIALKEVPRAETPLRAVGKIREAVDSLFACLRLLNDGEGKPPSTDDLLPLVILATLRARPKKLPSSLRRIEYYVGDHRMRGEAGFLLTQLSAAAAFLASCDASQLKGVDEEAFAKAVGVEARPEPAASPPPTPEDPRWPRAPPSEPATEVAAAVADLRLSETSAALRTEFTFAAAPAAEAPAEPTAEQPPDPPASPKRSYEEVNGPVPTGPVIDANGLAQQVREEEPLRGSLLDPGSLRELAEGLAAPDETRVFNN
jgi:hypothetical protein